MLQEGLKHISQHDTQALRDKISRREFDIADVRKFHLTASAIALASNILILPGIFPLALIPGICDMYLLTVEPWMLFQQHFDKKEVRGLRKELGLMETTVTVQEINEGTIFDAKNSPKPPVA